MSSKDLSRALKRFFSSILIIAHLVAFGPLKDALAFQAQSASYVLSTVTLSEGGNARTASSLKIFQDICGEAASGKSQSLSYILNGGYIPTLISNPPQQIQSLPNQSWPINQIKADAFDLDNYFMSPDNSLLAYAATGVFQIVVSINAVTHLASFSQAQGWSGTEKIRFKAIDANGNSILSNEVTLQVLSADNPPVLDFIPDISASEGGLVKIAPHATDADNDAITYSFTAPLNAQGEWQTGFNDAGLYTVTVMATDATGFKAAQQVRINVRNVNRPPVLNALADIHVQEGDLVVVTPTATDPDNDALNYYFTAPLDSSGRWQTGYSDSGTHTTSVTVSDGIDTVCRNVNIIVVNVNRAPTIALTLDRYTAGPGDQIAITLNASDPDQNGMTYDIKKDGQTIASGAITDAVAVSTTFSSIGDHVITATVTDQPGLSVTATSGVDIVDPNVNNSAINPVMGDFNADNLLDLGLYNADTGSVEVCYSHGGEFTSSVEKLSGFGSAGAWQPIGGDFNGDSRTDIGIYNGATGEFKTALSTGSEFSVSGTWFNFSNPSVSWQIWTGNFNADKYTDLAFYNKDSGEVRVACGTGSAFNAPTTWLNGGDTGYAAMSGDFNGDGLSDLCLFKKSSGEFKVILSNSKTFLDGSVWKSGYSVNQDPLLSDFNHDGLTDIGYWNKASATWYYAISAGAQFIDKGTWLNAFGSADDETATTGDFNGDGLIDRALFNRSAQGINRWKTKYNTLKPCDLLTEIDNGVGGKTQVTYTYASASDNASLPFPVYVASSISLIDSLPADQPVETCTQNFTFSGGYYDAVDREFRGFSKIKVTDPITNNYTETTFYQGKPGQDGALKGQIDKVQAFDGNNRPISQVLNTYDVRKAGPENNVLGFPSLTQIETTVWEENGSQITTRSQITYDNIGNVVEALDDGEPSKTGDEKTVATTYAPAYNNGFNSPLEVTLKDKDFNVVSKKTFEYDSKGNLSSENVFIFDSLNSSTRNSITQYAYDSFGNLTSTTDALNHTVTTEYETTYYAYPQRVTNALSQSISYCYDPKFGVVTSVTDANNNISTSTYDSFGRLLEAKNADNQTVTTYSYPDFNTKVTTNALALSKTEYYDGLGRKYKSVSSGEDGAVARQVSSEVAYNSRGLVDEESIVHYIDESPDQITYTRTEYDLRGRVKKTIADFPGTLKDAESRINYISPLYVETTDPQGHKKGTLKDVYGNILEVTEFTSGGVFKTQYEYDIQNNLTKTTDSKGNVTQIWYDSIGRKLKMNDPDMGVWTYEYDVLGNLIKQTDAKAQALDFEYDALNRLIHKVTKSQSHQVTGETNYSYDDTTKQNCIGRLSKITDPSGQTEFFYDKFGREIKSTKTVDATPYTVERTYDILDRLLTLQYPDGEIVNYSYDTNSGLLEKVCSVVGGLSSVDYVKDITYNAKAQIKAIQYGNNTQTTYTYGQDLRLSRILTQGATPLQDLNYIFDKNGNITTLTDNLRNNIRTYAYDDLDRLTQANNVPSPSGGTGNFNYQYDSIGNMIYKSDVGIMAYGSAAGPHALTSAGGYGYQYDPNGNMTVGKNKILSYDVENRLISVVSGPLTVNYLYDGDGGRVKQTTVNGPQTTATTYIGSLFEKEVNQLSGSPVTRFTKHIFAGSQKVCSVNWPAGQPENRTTSYYHPDHLGSSSVITDQNGQQLARYEYSPYGATVVSELANGQTSQPVNYFFTGKELDPTGLYFYGARYYDPEIGRFLTADTIVQSPFNPQTLNRYSYCANNPLNYVDPSGHFWFIAAIIGAIIGATVGGISAGVSGTSIAQGIGFGAIQGAFSAFGAFGGAIGGVVVAAVNGGNIGAGALSGFVGGMTGGLIGGATGNVLGAFWGAVIGGAAGGAAGGAVGAQMTGGDVGQGAAMGAAWGAAGGIIGYGAYKAMQGRQSQSAKTKESLNTDQKPTVSPSKVNSKDSPHVNQKIYRVFGDKAKMDGRFWTPVDPESVPNYRVQGGLPNENSGRFVAEARITQIENIVVGEATVIYANGDVQMITQYEFLQDPNPQIKLERVSGANPEY